MIPSFSRALKGFSNHLSPWGAFVAAGIFGILLVPILSAGWREGVPPSLLGGGLAEELALARWKTRNLRLEAELAARKEPYLYLDLEEETLTLRMQGVVLRTYPTLKLTPRSERGLSWLRKSHSVLDTIWEEGTLLPRVHRERDVVLADTVTPPDPSETVVRIPPSPEEAVPTPPSFLITFRGGASLLVREGFLEGSLEEEEQGRPGYFAGALHWVRMKPWKRHRFMVEIVLHPPDGGALYRSFPEGAPILLVAPPPRKSEPSAVSERSA